MIALLFTSFFALLVFGMPIVLAMAISSLFYLIGSGIPVLLIAQRITTSLLSFPLMAIPFYILLAETLNAGSATRRLIRLVTAVVGFVRGGLGIANVLLSMIFAGISGTALADTSSLGATLIPSMEEEGYPIEYAAAVTAASSTVGPIIPPSVPMIVAAVIAELSVTDLFMAGAIPGLLMGVAMMIVAYAVAVKRGFPRSAQFSLREIGLSFKDSVFEFFLIASILLGIVGGFFTATEAGAMGATFALVLGIARRELNFQKVRKACVETVVLSGIVLIIVGFASVFGWIIAKERVPTMFADWLLGITKNPVITLLLINICLLVVGAVMETTAALIIVLPTMLALGAVFQISPIQMTVIVVFNLILGLLTPPVGMALYIVSSISKKSIGVVLKEMAPFFVANLVVLALVCVIPQLTLWLPAAIRAFGG